MNRLIYLNLLVISLLSTIHASAQSDSNETESAPEALVQRPAKSDASSLKIVKNYLTTSGRAAAHRKLKNIHASGTMKEAGKLKSFELYETATGKRWITYTWRHLGRNYSQTYATDGVTIWQQTNQPKEELAKKYGSKEAEHFAKQFWFLHPTLSPEAEDVVYEYQGTAKVASRGTYLVVAYDADNVRSWFYFDQETFLPIRWGGLGLVAGVEEYLDYRCSHYEAVEQVHLPKAIDLLVENTAYGQIQFTSIQANEYIDDTLFEMPKYESPVLRQAGADTASEDPL